MMISIPDNEATIYLADVRPAAVDILTSFCQRALTDLSARRREREKDSMYYQATYQRHGKLTKKADLRVLANTTVISTYYRSTSKVNGQDKGWSARYTAAYQETSNNTNEVDIKWRRRPDPVSLLLFVTSHNTSATTEISA
jgi:hypothetical protein